MDAPSTADTFSPEFFARFEQRPEKLVVDASGYSDAPAKVDSLGFETYADAIAAFLLAENTRPPLTMSVEGEWGSGKSSLMLLVERKITEELKRKRQNHRVIRFNAWHDKADSLWAAFALGFIQQLSDALPLHRRLWAKLKLKWRRFDWDEGVFHVAKALCAAVTLIALVLWALIGKEHGVFKLLGLEGNDAAVRAGQIGIFAAIATAIASAMPHIKHWFGNPFTQELAKFAASPDYKGHVGFLSKFQQDFSRVIKTYVGDTGRIYVFVDDIDRCEVPVAVNVAHALNMLLASCGDNLIFILGLDRDIVAAGITAKYAQILPYLSDNVTGRMQRRWGSGYGHAFLEKFIQVPFKLPRPNAEAIAGWLNKMSTQQPASRSEEGVSEGVRRFVVEIGTDASRFMQLVQEFAPLLDFNPRKIKVFTNILRLRMCIAYETGLFETDLKWEQFAFFTAITTHWPEMIGDLVRNPKLLSRLYNTSTADTDDVTYWRSKTTLMEFIRSGRADLSSLDVEPLLAIMPRRFRIDEPIIDPVGGSNPYGRHDDEAVEQPPAPSGIPMHDGAATPPGPSNMPKRERRGARRPRKVSATGSAPASLPPASEDYMA
jgi:hypothetical protein